MRMTKAERVATVEELVNAFDGFLSLSGLSRAIKADSKAETEQILGALLNAGKISKRQLSEIKAWSKSQVDGSIHSLHKHKWRPETIAKELKVPLESVRFALGLSVGKLLTISLCKCYIKEPERTINLLYTFIRNRVGKATGHQGPDYKYLNGSPEGIKEDLASLLDLLSEGEALCDENLVIPRKIKSEARQLVTIFITYNLLPLETNKDLKEFLKTKL